MQPDRFVLNPVLRKSDLRLVVLIWERVHHTTGAEKCLRTSSITLQGDPSLLQSDDLCGRPVARYPMPKPRINRPKRSLGIFHNKPARIWKDSTVAEKLPTSFPHAGK